MFAAAALVAQSVFVPVAAPDPGVGAQRMMLVGLIGPGWFGVHLVEIARRAPPGRSGRRGKRYPVFSFGGAFLAPVVFGLLISMTAATPPASRGSPSSRW